MADSYLSRSFTGTPTMTKYTYSVWLKKTKLGAAQQIAEARVNSTNLTAIYFGSNEALNIYQEVSGSVTCGRYTDMRFKDTSSWYHIVIQVDTTLATAADRVKVWVNGVQQGLQGTTQTQNLEHNFLKSTAATELGRAGSNANYFEGNMTHIVMVQGSILAPTAFGQVDSGTGQWKFKTVSNVSFGTNGFHLKMENSAALGTDSSGNNQTFTVNGSLKQSNSTPSILYNSLQTYLSGRNFGGNLNVFNANTTGNETSNGWQLALSNMGVRKGKWYYEYKIQVLGTGNGYHKVGFGSSIAAVDSSVGHLADTALDGGYAFYCQNGNLEVRTNAAVISGYSNSDLGVSFSVNDIMCLAIDMDNAKAYFRKNDDAWIKSANPVAGTNGLDISADYPVGNTMKFLMPGIAIYYGGTGSINFGTGFFGSQPIASAGSNGNGALFEFDVPTGYYAINTKNLNTYG